MNALLFVVVVVIVVVTVQVAIWVPLAKRWSRENAAFWSAFDADVAAGRERVVAGPEPANYRGSSGPGSAVKGNGRLVLTDRRLLFRKTTGGVVEVGREAITGVREEAVFLGTRVAGKRVLVVETVQGDVGFFVDDNAAWGARLGSGGAA